MLSWLLLETFLTRVFVHLGCSLHWFIFPRKKFSNYLEFCTKEYMLTKVYFKILFYNKILWSGVQFHTKSIWDQKLPWFCQKKKTFFLETNFAEFRWAYVKFYYIKSLFVHFFLILCLSFEIIHNFWFHLFYMQFKLKEVTDRLCYKNKK